VAKIEKVVLIDDLSGDEAAESIRFGLDGESYMIDLSEGNAVRLRSAIAPFVEAARKISKGKAAVRPSRTDRQLIREWATANGLTVQKRGRIPEDVLAAWRSR